MASDKNSKPRGRPRSEAARQAILNAAKALLEEGGLGAVTIEGIAARAGISKPTIYRSWPNAHAVAMAAMIQDGDAKPAAARRGRTAQADLRAQLRRMVDVFATRMGRNVTMMLAASHGETEISKAFRNYFISARREEGREIFKRALDEGDVRRDIDVEVALDLIYGPIFYRLLVGHGPLDANFTDGVLQHAWKGLAR